MLFKSEKKILLLCALSFSIVTHPLAAFEKGIDSKNTKTTSIESESSAVYEDDDFFYLGIKAGSNYYQNACEPWATNCEHRDFAYGAFAGYRFNENFSIETGYLELGEVNAIYPESGLQQPYVGAVSSWELGLSFDFPITESFTTFLKVSANNWSAENRSQAKTLKDDGWSPAGELGLTYQLSDNFQTRLSYQYIDGLGSDKVGASNGHIAWLGITYQFKSDRKPNIVASKPPAKLPVVEVVAAQLAKVEFAFDSIKFMSTEQLELLIAHALKYSQINIYVKTHTDSTGNQAYNQNLSERRAQSITDLLISRGVNEKRIYVSAFGELSPVFDNETLKHRRLNRQAIITTKAFEVSREEVK
jgi:OOP family OmpA-OmpF porin